MTACRARSCAGERWRFEKAVGSSPRSARREKPLNASELNRFVVAHLKILEMIGVLMRIGSFSWVSWLGPDSPFLGVWIVNTLDTVLLTWCARVKRDAAYTLA